jgi:hypothetical protein
VATVLQDLVRGRTVNGRPVLVRTLRSRDPIEGSHVVFVSTDAGSAASAILRRAEQLGMLSVTEAPDGLERGAIINFVTNDRNVKFEVALDTAERAGVRLSARLLGVAVRVRGGPTR